MFDIIRIGKIHTIDYANAMASVIYSDRDNQPSPKLPFFSFAYEMPQVDDTVVVILLPNSTSKGFILGVPWSVVKKPSVSGSGIFYKEFQDGSYIKYNSKDKTMEVSAPNIKLKSVTAENVTADELIADNVETKSLRAENLFAETAEIINLNVTGTATGNFQITGSKGDNGA